MFRPIVFVCLLSATTFAGCISEPASTKSLGSLFGDAALEVVAGNVTVAAGIQLSLQNQTTVIKGAVLEGFIESGGGAASWNASAALTLEAPKLTIPKQRAGPMGGGGVARDLEAPAVNATLRVRFNESADLAGYEVRWGVAHGQNRTLVWTDPVPAQGTHALPLTSAGQFFVVAELLVDGTVSAVTGVPFTAVVNVKWVVESSVHPVRPAGAPAPMNYEQMADKFQFPVPTDGAKIVAETRFRGMWLPPQGTDVDLGLLTPDGRPAKCSGSGGQGGVVPFVPSAAEANEKTEVSGAVHGLWTARVGSQADVAQPPAGSMCGSGYYYHNADMVPYTLEVTVQYK